MRKTSEGQNAQSGARPVPPLEIDVFGDQFLSDPHRYHGILRDAGPLFYLSRYQIYGMARYTEVSASLKDWRRFTSSRGVGLGDFAKEAPWRPPSLLLETDPPVHDRTRALMNKIVSLGALKDIRPLWQNIADTMIDALVEQDEIDGICDVAQAYPLTVFPELIGLPREGREHLLVYAAATFNAFGPRNHLFESTDKAAAPAAAWVAKACERHSLEPGRWGAQVYDAADAGECTVEEAARLTRSFLSAGVDTTVNGIGNMLHAFARHPDEWQKLRDNPALIRRVFDESLRWDSTVQTFFRTTSEPVEIADQVIPEGSKVLLFLAAANRDPRKWADANRFDISRVASGHVGFGYGIHQCLGQMVARQEAEVILEAMISRVREVKLLGEPKRILNNTLHAIGSLPLRLVKA